MKIAQIAVLVERVPPKKYGGAERVIHALTEELVRRGHDVVLFASGDSITSARLQSVYHRNLREAKLRDIYGGNILNLMNVGLAYQMEKEFDIIHDHTGFIGAATANIAKTPTVMTMHGPLDPETRQIFNVLRRPNLVTISHSQSSPARDLNYAGMVYNGLQMENYPFSEKHDGYLLFVGRISMEKGVHFAVEAAQELNLPLIIAAKLEPVDKLYFQEYIEPCLSENIKWIGEVDENERNILMSKAKCLLQPVTWREPFGLVLIEAMACGCPIVAFNKGSIPEIVENGKTGFVVDDLDGMLDSILNVDSIDRSYCRQYALLNFSAQKMADGYEKIYREVLAKNLKNDDKGQT